MSRSAEASLRLPMGNEEKVYSHRREAATGQKRGSLQVDMRTGEVDVLPVIPYGKIFCCQH
ncbi:hypothetical protein XSR1_100057 [Xenorhabdus szentirmaii DSM 16338]|uniref:Uncharacterized protein n=1 Tax=Xenorhabdus szentirmaii DSM 16338 TaxID=1427518 RepID=W1IT61_9GAMM|nr:hypothetical protein XSR1_100057 [Xenorhabdus szentirmaii DSM 16338]